MATFYTDRQKDKIRRWLLELREIVNPIELISHRDRATELVSRLDQCKFERHSTMDDEFHRVRRIWNRLETGVQQAKAVIRLAENPNASPNRARGF